MSSKESGITNESNYRHFIEAENQGQHSGDHHSIEEAATELSLYARYVGDIAPALSKRELRNELLTVRRLARNLGEAIERSS